MKMLIFSFILMLLGGVSTVQKDNVQAVVKSLSVDEDIGPKENVHFVESNSLQVHITQVIPISELRVTCNKDYITYFNERYRSVYNDIHTPYLIKYHNNTTQSNLYNTQGIIQNKNKNMKGPRDKLRSLYKSKC